LFATLGDLDGLRVLDLYAGSGALGIEALSRGATHVTFVDRAANSIAVLQRNLDELGVRERARVTRDEVLRALRRLARMGECFDLVLADPPYASRDAARVLLEPATRAVLAPGGALVLEFERRHALPAPEGLVEIDARHYGDTAVARFVATGDAEARGLSRARPNERSIEGMTAKSGERRIALFPASFDPVTNGHLDVVRRARRLFDEVVLAVAVNVAKSGCFQIEERLSMLNAVIRDDSGLRTAVFEGLTVDYAREIGACAIIRGVRAMSDFEYEFEMALMNKHLYPELETIFMMPSQEYLYVSSSRLRELARFGRDVSEFVPELVAVKLKERFAPRS
jgi:pantetheine-phosphate adenylyltransferase